MKTPNYAARDPFFALQNYANAHVSSGFDAQFWARMNAQTQKRQTLRGQMEWAAQTQLGGVAVWRLLASSIGGAVPAFLVFVGLLFVPQTPIARAPISPQMALMSPFYLREFWEENRWKKPFKNFDYTLVLNLDALAGGQKCVVTSA